MESNSPILIYILFFLVALVILILLLRYWFLKNKEAAQQSTSDHYKRKEIQNVDAGAVIIPGAPQRTSAHWEKYRQGNALLDAQKMEEAIVIFKELAAIPEETESAMISLGTCYNLTGDRDNALASYKTALDLSPENYNALLGMASVNYKMTHYPNAVVYYKKANALRPDLPDAYWGLAAAYHMLQEKELASENAKIFIRMEPESRYRVHLEKMIID